MIAAVGLSLFTGCDYDDDYTPPNYVTFASEEREVSVLDTGSETVEVTVFTADVSGSDRSFTVTVDESSTLDPSSYTVPGTVTVPANSNEGSFSVEITGSGVSNDGDVIVLELEEDAELSAGEPLTIDVAKICPFELSNFVGTFGASEVFTAGTNEGYSFAEANEVTLQVELVADADDENSLVLTNSPDFFEFIDNGTVLTFNPAEESFSVPSDLTIFGQPFVVSSTNINSCGESLSFTGELGEFGEYTVTLQKQ